MTSVPRQQKGAARNKTDLRSGLTPFPILTVIPRTWETTRGTVTALNPLTQTNTSKRKIQRTTSKRKTLN